MPLVCIPSEKTETAFRRELQPMCLSVPPGAALRMRCTHVLEHDLPQHNLEQHGSSRTRIKCSSLHRDGMREASENLAAIGLPARPGSAIAMSVGDEDGVPTSDRAPTKFKLFGEFPAPLESRTTSYVD